MKLQKLKGLWIPVEVLLDENLSDKEKMILSIVLCLNEENKGCFASNKYIASIVNVSHQRVSKIINSLKNKGYVNVKLKYKTESKEIEKRLIAPIVKNDRRYSQEYPEGTDINNYLDSQNETYYIVKNDKDIINNIKNKKEDKKETNYILTKRKNNNYEERIYPDGYLDFLYANKEFVKHV